MPTSLTRTYSGHKLQPVFPVGPSPTVAVNLQANLSLAAGTLLGEVAATPGTFGPYGNATIAAPSAPTLTDGASSTSAPWPATQIVGVVTFLSENGETVGSTGTTFTPAGGHLLHVAVIALPAGATGINVYAGPTAATAQLIGTSATGAAADYPYPAYTLNPVYPPTVNTARTPTRLAAPTGAPVPTDSGSAGEWPAQEILVGYTYYNAAGETTIGPLAEFTPVGSKLLHIAALTPPAGATGINFYAGADISQLVQIGTTTTGNAADYDVPDAAAPSPPTANTALAATDGTEVPKLILADDVTTDANGNVILGLGVTANEFGTVLPSAPAYRHGAFKTTDLVGLDSAVLALPGWRLSSGTITNGVLELLGG